MKKLYEMPNTAINPQTRDEMKEYMKMCDDVGWVWSGNGKASYRLNNWNVYEQYTCMEIENRFGYGSTEYFKNSNYTILTLKELKEKLGMWKKGDVLIDEYGTKCLIMETLGVLLFTSTNDNFKETEGECYTQNQLEEYSWKLYTEDVTEDETVELTFKDISEGKGKGVDPSKIKIVEGDK
jgi:hypothetical protein